VYEFGVIYMLLCNHTFGAGEILNGTAEPAVGLIVNTPTFPSQKQHRKLRNRANPITISRIGLIPGRGPIRIQVGQNHLEEIESAPACETGHPTIEFFGWRRGDSQTDPTPPPLHFPLVL
jgi:hypothetical protein